MAKFHGVVGFLDGQVEKRRGVFVDNIVEREYFGDVKRASQQFRHGEGVNDDITVGHTIEIVADEFANTHMQTIRFVEWAGECWKVEDRTRQHPRLILRLREVYNGPRADAASGDEAGGTP